MKGKIIRLLLLFMVCTAFLSANATPLDDIQKQVKEVLCDGKTQNFSSLLDNEVEVSIQEGNKAKGKSQALSAVQNYVGKCRPYNFIVTHKTEKMQSGYLMGKLQTSSGQHQVQIRLKKGASNNFMIYQLRIENSND